MATIVCRQGLQSCLESHLVEPRALRLKLSPHFSQPLELAIKSCFFDSNIKEVNDKKHCCFDEEEEEEVVVKKSSDSGGWSFLQALSNGPQYSKKIEEKENSTAAYVHPLVKRSLSTLSEKSLELCTENLGNETGSDILEDSSIFSALSCSVSDCEGGNDSPTRKQLEKPRQLWGAKKATNIARNFPPPLTTISGSESLQVRTHREEGRLVIKAIKAPSSNTLFHAERSNGRLRLCLFKDNSTPSFDYQEEEEEAAAADEISEESKQELENDSNSREAEAEAKEEEEYEEEEEEEEDDVNAAEMAMKKLQRGGRGRCKEGGEHHHHHHLEKKGLLNWEPVWVATS